MTFPKWLLEEDEIELAQAHGFKYQVLDDRFYLKRQADDTRIWPHIDGYISCFIRQGTFVKHKKFLDLKRALERRFGDD